MQNLIDEVPLFDCMKQLGTLTQLDLAECVLSSELQKNLQVHFVASLSSIVLLLSFLICVVMVFTRAASS